MKVLELDGLYEGKYRLVLSEEAERELNQLKNFPIPPRQKVHPLATFVFLTPPSGATLFVRDTPVDDENFFLVVLLQHYSQTLGTALQDGNVRVSFAGN
ncbi:hypothetical protein G20c_20 [Thermus phage G20c]|nr:hypothetical protein G20c_20 [Thermus phage G20c]